MKLVVLRIVLLMLCLESSLTKTFAQEVILGEPFISVLRFRVADSTGGWDNMLDEISPSLTQKSDINKRSVIAKRMVEKNFPTWSAYEIQKDQWVFAKSSSLNGAEQSQTDPAFHDNLFFLAYRVEVLEGETKDALKAPLVFLQRKLDKNCYWNLSGNANKKHYKMGFHAVATVGEFKGWYLTKGAPREKIDNHQLWDITLTQEKPKGNRNVIDGIDGP